MLASLRAYVDTLLRVYGWRFLVFLLCSQLLLKGALAYLASSIMLPIYKSVMGIDAASMQLYSMITMVPWSIKPLLGLLSDYVAVRGLHKQPWLLLSAAVGLLGAALSFAALNARSAVGLAVCLACVQLQVAMYDLMTEAVFSARMRDQNAGSEIVTLSQTLQTLGGLGATLLVGLEADRQAYTTLLVITCITCVVPLAPTLLGWISEERDDDGDHTCCGGQVTFAAGIAQEQRGSILVVFFIGVAAPVTAVVISVGDPAIGLSIAALFCTAAVAGAYRVFPRIVAHLALYQVIRNIAAPSISGAMDYWYTADATCVANGPHFSYGYYMTVAGVIGYGAMLVGTLIYQLGLSRMRFRNVLMLTSVLAALTGASDLFIVTRANVALGIPDKAAFIVGEAILEPALGMLAYIPIAVLLSKSVPRGMEASVYSFLAGLSNFSSIIRELSGALLFDGMGIETTVPCDFVALPWLIFVCHFASPLVVGVAASYWLIPNTEQSEPILDAKPNVVVESDNEFGQLID